MNITNSKFIHILKTLNQEELKSFELFLKSPWCNTNKNNLRLLEKIKAYYPDFATPKMEKEKLFKRILPNGKFSDRRMNNILSEAYLALEQFITFSNLKKKEGKQQEILIEEFQTLGLKNTFFKEIKEAIHQLETKPIKDWENYLSLLQLYRRMYHHPVQNQHRLPDEDTIVKMGETLKLVYLLESATIITEKIERSRIFKKENHEVEKDLTIWRITSEAVAHPAVEFYRMRFNDKEENKIEQYLKLRELFLNNFKTLSQKEQKIHFALLRNDVIQLIRGGYFDITELLPFYKIGLKNDLLIENGILPYISFSAIVSTSNTSKDFSFTKEVIEGYGQKLDVKIKKEAKAWAIAHTYYYQEKLEDCLDILISQEFRNKYFLQISKLLTLQVYFDLHLTNDAYRDYLFSYFDSFEKWIQREKFNSITLKKSYSRFVQVCRLIAKFYQDVNFKRENIEHLLESESNIQASEWLQRKLKLVIKLKG